MKKRLEHVVFDGWHAADEMVNFINRNNILQSNILKLTYSSHPDMGLHLFYYVEIEG